MTLLRRKMNGRAASLAAIATLMLAAAAAAHPPTAADGSLGVAPHAPSVPSPYAAADLDACERGSSESCYRMSERLHGGDGVSRDNPRSVEFVRLACDQEYPRACYDLGVRHVLGAYVEQDFDQAIHWVLRACDLDYGVACYFAGTLVRDGVGVPREIDASVGLMHRACELGYGDACSEIGVGVAGPGEEVARLPVDVGDALRELAGACDAGVVGACADLAESWEVGDGVTADVGHAEVLRERACNWGLLRACEALGRE